MSFYYLLNEDEEPYRVDGYPTKEDWENRFHLVDEVNGLKVSTVFLVVDHDYFGGAPILFETMVFEQGRGIYQDRYCTIEDAKKGHRYAIEWVKNGCKDNRE